MIPRLLPLVPLLLCAAQSVSMEGGAFRVRGWQAGAEPADGWSSVFAVYAGPEGVPPLAGVYAIERGELTFRPRYPLAAGLRVRARFQGREFAFETEKAAPLERTTRVEQVYPSGDVLPENQLKLYICFSAPVQTGEAWERLQLLDSRGERVKLPFVEIEQELWNPSHTRLTVLFDPGRIKRGLLPLREIGPAIREGETYTLVVDAGWRDGRGAALAAPYRKTFRVGPPDREPVDPARWQILRPQKGTTDALVVRFDEPLDFAMVQHSLAVFGVDGKVDIGRGETEWRFTPVGAWKDDEYQLVVQTALEDRAGNRVGRAFDVDTARPVKNRVTGESVVVRFRPR